MNSGSGAPGAGPASLAFAIALLWTLHPLHTQAVTYTVQRAESLTGFFYLLTLYAFLRATKCHLSNDTSAAPSSRGTGARCHLIDDAGPAAGRWRSLSIGACLLGMATKEIMATAPLVVLLFDRTFVAGSFNAAWRARRGYYLALAATWLLLAALVASTGGNRGGTAGLGVGVPLWAYPLTQFEAITRYLALSFWPHPLIFEYGTFWVQRAADVLPFAAVGLSLLAATIVALWRRPVAGFLGAAFFLILAPTSLTPGTIQMIVEHRMYLPLAAVLTAAGLAFRRLLPARVVVAAGFAVAIAFVLLTLRRNHDYRSHVALWTDTIAKRPENPRAHEGLAEAWVELGQPERALAHRAAAIRLRPADATYHYNLGLTQMTAGRLEDAVRSFERALRLNPSEPRAHNNLAIVLGRLGRRAEALAHYTEAVRLQPGEAQYHENFALALYRAGRIADAIAQFDAALRLRPNHAATRNSLAAAHHELGNAALDAERLAEAAAHFAAAIQHRPDHAESHHNLGVAYARQERWEDARHQFEAALRLKPDYTDAQRNLEQLRVLLGGERQPRE